ncbi:MAG: hypothetical protein JWL93_1549 [Hyphomicrobiales bacterium]|nr:hypothetical protein [Hyphomicrobiales bacterium]
MKASTFSFRAAVLLAVAGISLGVYMGASHDHTMRAVHAHINLLGWVSLFLMGIFYKLHPALDVGRAAKWQAAIWTFGTVVLASAIAGIYAGYPAAEPFAAAGSLLLLADLLLFAYLVFRPAGSTAGDRVAAPAE